MRFPIEVEFTTAGSVIYAIRRASLITILMLRVGYAPSMYQRIWDRKTRCSTWLISYDYLPDLINEFLTLSSIQELHRGEATTNGEPTKE